MFTVLVLRSCTIVKDIKPNPLLPLWFILPLAIIAIIGVTISTVVNINEKPLTGVVGYGDIAVPAIIAGAIGYALLPIIVVVLVFYFRKKRGHLSHPAIKLVLISSILLFSVVHSIGSFHDTRYNLEQDYTRENPTGKYVKYSGDGFTVNFPNEPTVQNAPGNTRYASSSDDATYLLDAYDVSNNIEAGDDARTILNYVNNTKTDSYRIVSQSNNAIVLGYPAASSVAESQQDGVDISLYEKLILKGNVLYALGVYAVSDNPNLQQALDEFVASLKFNP